jgi:hypothetical protein
METLARSAPDGCFAEIGVFNGGSAYRLYQIALAQGRTLHLFDTFEGTPNYTEGLDKHKIDAEFAAPAAPAQIRELMPTAQLHIGPYPDTHPPELRHVAFIHCDCDQYLSYKAVIDNMWPLVVPGGFMLFDDYPYLAGARKAVEEAFPTKSLRMIGARYYVTKEASP